MAGRLTYLFALTLVLGLAHSSIVSGADPDLAAWWKLDGSAVDSSGNGHDGVLFGDPEWVEGFIGGALAFDGVDDRVEMPTTSPAQGFPTVDGEVTWMLWLKTGASAAIKTPIALGPAGAEHIQGNRSINVEASGVIMMRAHSVGDLTSVSSVATVNDDEWHHVAVTIAFDADGTNDPMKAYIDGDLDQGYEADNININLHKGPAADFIMTLGARGATPFDGLMDDVRIYERVLTADEVQLIMLSGGEPIPNAYGPKPRNDSMIDEKSTLLEWVAGDFAVSHEVYFGESFDDVNDGLVTPVAATETSLREGFVPPYPAGLTPGQTYYWRVDEVNDVHPDSPWKGDVWSFRVRPAVAWEPSPADGLLFIEPNQDLTWQTGLGSFFHTVYFGESFEEVQNAGGGGMMTVQATYDPGTLEPETTYYWRVDEFDGMQTRKGDVWSFTTVSEVAVTDPNLAIWWTLDEGMGMTAVDWSGHNYHGIVNGDAQWTDGFQGTALTFADDVYVETVDDSGIAGAAPRTCCAWIKTATANRNIMSWGQNVAGQKWRMRLDATGGLRIEVNGGYNYGVTNLADGRWHHVALTFEDDGSPDALDTLLYVDGQLDATAASLDEPIDTATGPVRIGESPWHNAPFIGQIDDARVYDKVLTAEQIQQVMRGDPLLAGDPEPARGAVVDIQEATTLRWSRGDTAASHDVYFGTDRDAVRAADNDAPEFRGNQPGTSLSLAGLVEFGGGDYYWRIDEVEADGTVHVGSVWTFTVPDYLIVDDFESYDDDIEGGTTIYQTWIDGFDNGTGSTVGYLTSANGTFGETSIVHSGGQSMPLTYDNVVAPGISEADRTFTPAQDWTAEGVTALVVYFRGQADNTGQLYLKINGTKVPYDGDATDIAGTAWIAWEIDLVATGINAASVTTLTIGVEGGQTGVLYIDDIRLTKP